MRQNMSQVIKSTYFQNKYASRLLDDTVCRTHKLKIALQQFNF